MPADTFRCQCRLGCVERATQEDMLCDTCRETMTHHMHVNEMQVNGDASFFCGPGILVLRDVQ